MVWVGLGLLVRCSSGFFPVCARCVIFACVGGGVCAGDCRSLPSSCLSGGIFPIFLRVFLLSLSSPVGFWPFGFFVVPQSGILVGTLGGVWEGRCSFFSFVCASAGARVSAAPRAVLSVGVGAGILARSGGVCFPLVSAGALFCVVIGVGAFGWSLASMLCLRQRGIGRGSGGRRRRIAPWRVLRLRGWVRSLLRGRRVWGSALRVAPRSGLRWSGCRRALLPRRWCRRGPIGVALVCLRRLPRRRRLVLSSSRGRILR